MDLQYEAELQNKMIEYDRICSSIDQLTESKTKLRTQIKEWLALNSLDEYYILDPNEQWWKIGTQLSHRKKINDWNDMRAVLGAQYTSMVSETETESFIVKKVKAPK